MVSPKIIKNTSNNYVSAKNSVVDKLSTGSVESCLGGVSVFEGAVRDIVHLQFSGHHLGMG